MATKTGESFVGRYGDALRRLTALDSQGGTFAAQKVGGADTGGFGPTLQVQPGMPQQGAFGPAVEQQPAMEQAAPAAPAPQAQPAAPAFGGAPEMGAGEFSPMDNSAGGPAWRTPGIAGPIQQGGDKPTTFGDLVSSADDDEKEELVAQVEKHGKLEGMMDKVRKVLGADQAPKMSRHETASYIAEIAMRAMSKRTDPRYAQNPDGVFADAVLETDAAYKQESEKRRLEGREDAQTARREQREDTIHTRNRGESAEDHTRDRSEKLEDDERNHKQAIELAKIQAKLLRDRGQRTSIQVGDDGELKLIDLETGEAVTVTEEEEVTETKGSRGKGTSTTTKKTRKPVKAAPKYNAGGLDDDTLVNRISDAEKALRADKKLMRELGSKFANDRVKIESALRDMAREKVEGDVQSLGGGGSAPSAGKRTKFSDLK